MRCFHHKSEGQCHTMNYKRNIIIDNTYYRNHIHFTPCFQHLIIEASHIIDLWCSTPFLANKVIEKYDGVDKMMFGILPYSQNQTITFSILFGHYVSWLTVFIIPFDKWFFSDPYVGKTVVFNINYWHKSWILATYIKKI